MLTERASALGDSGACLLPPTGRSAAAALRRLGLDYEFIDYLLEFDRRNEQVVRTAYGDSTPFTSERATVPQGGVESCLVFVSVVDWMLALDDARAALRRLPSGRSQAK